MKAIFMDIETDGLDPDMHVALEIAISCIDLHKAESVFEYESFIRCSEREWNFGADQEALRINGIRWEDVKDAKQSSEICGELTDLFIAHGIDKFNSVFICQNPSFDRPFFAQIMPLETQHELNLPYHWLDLASMYWVLHYNRFDPELLSLRKDSIAMKLGIPPEEKPHRAMQGVKHLMQCYAGLKYKAFNPCALLTP